MAKAFPKSEFVGYDFHPGSIEEARRARGAAWRHCQCALRGRLWPRTIPARGFDLVTCFDCLHDMGDPAGAAAHVRQSLKPDGTWMIVEPMAGDALRAEHQSGRPALLRRLDHDLRADVTRRRKSARRSALRPARRSCARSSRAAASRKVRRATETPFNMILEARP